MKSLFLFIFAAQLQEAAAFAFSGTQISPSRDLLSIRARSTRVGPLLSSTANDAEDNNNKKIEGRKNRVIMGYKAMMVSYLATGVLSAVRIGKLTTPLLQLLAGYIAMPAGASYIMISAAENDRLGSDTYKRLNLALLEYGLLGLCVVALGGNKNRLLALAFILSIINSIKGYAYGVLGWEKNSDTTLLKDLMKGTKETVKGFVSIPKNIKSAIYLAATLMIASLKLLKLKEIVEFIQANSITAGGLAPLLARFNRLALFTLVLYTLKDAADRDRLGGTTFIELNYLSALSMACCNIVTGGGAAASPYLATPLGMVSAAFAAFFMFNGVSNDLKK